ncbi:methyl-accepting chemotaxis protein [Pseudooceanicola sediminis]|uniref:Methyl-accepting chemotaxis protein n=1 Tax=Pseudooceanicola sediminis TaxID=2211117 RepID=A0A399JDH0_9RHOB|nr:methyl-accepting chemotaxis protein [Pseudooceanicola sediminis]KAA2316880.1 methyl-accepting chemotaxis protein [Puniceibacterium sp. HSS470]RII40666.1 methyl-accepting chemotaxis protein [Pseudooceanicola sediminis]|tara:strand:+ start:119069 stop:120475 length:1407 start_codon:yes stop_codon:yes gene_type:complete
MEQTSTFHDPSPVGASLDRLAENAASLGQEVVDVEGFLEDLNQRTGDLLAELRNVRKGTGTVLQMNASVMVTIQEAYAELEQTQARFLDGHAKTRQAGELGRQVTDWIDTLERRTGNVGQILTDVQQSNNQVAAIATQVNMLAINAKIEAARAGEAGRGFSVVADAINALSQQTGVAADLISENVQRLVDWIIQLQKETGSVAKTSQTLSGVSKMSQELTIQVRDALDLTVGRMKLVRDDAVEADRALRVFSPQIEETFNIVRESADAVAEVHDRVHDLVDLSETLVQDSVMAGGGASDLPLIRAVQARASQITQLFNDAIDSGRISFEDMFDEEYRSIPRTNPEQLMAPFTALTDSLLPEILETALDLDERIVFCAAVDRNGYLPTHNRKFSEPQGDDPVWNMAHSRNRRIFDDRVGLKAGRNKTPFLMQVYRRDMGGGEFMLMKDLSAPIFVKNRHWGGLRLAFQF